MDTLSSSDRCPQCPVHGPRLETHARLRELIEKGGKFVEVMGEAWRTIRRSIATFRHSLWEVCRLIGRRIIGHSVETDSAALVSQSDDQSEQGGPLQEPPVALREEQVLELARSCCAAAEPMVKAALSLLRDPTFTHQVFNVPMEETLPPDLNNLSSAEVEVDYVKNGQVVQSHRCSLLSLVGYQLVLDVSEALASQVSDPQVVQVEPMNLMPRLLMLVRRAHESTGGGPPLSNFNPDFGEAIEKLLGSLVKDK